MKYENPKMDILALAAEDNIVTISFQDSGTGGEIDGSDMPW